MAGWYGELGKLIPEKFTHQATVSHFYVRALLFTGLRATEVRTLIKEVPPDWRRQAARLKKRGQALPYSGGYDKRDQTIHLLDPKNSEERIVPVNIQLADAFEELEAELVNESNWWFPSASFKRAIDDSAVRHWIDETASSSKVKAISATR